MEWEKERKMTVRHTLQLLLLFGFVVLEICCYFPYYVVVFIWF